MVGSSYCFLLRQEYRTQHEAPDTMTHETARDYRKSMKIALFITLIFLLVEIAGGLLSGSLALISDAGHMFSDLLALILSLGAMTLALQLPTKERTYGYHRTEIFAAFINSLLLIGVSAGILWEAYIRVINPAPVQGGLMFIVALIGLAANLSIVFLLHGSHNLNVRSAFLHVLGDTISSVAVIAAAAWITFTGQVIARSYPFRYYCGPHCDLSCQDTPRYDHDPSPVHAAISGF